MDTDLLEAQREPVRRYLRSLGASPEDVEDVAQEALLRVWRTYQPSRGPLRAYARRLAKQRLICSLRKRHPEAMEPPDLPVDGGSDLPVRSAVQGLPEGLREVVDLTAEGYLPPEVAVILGITPAAVKGRLRTARQRLREELS